MTRHWKRWLALCVILAVAVALAAALAIESGFAERWIRAEAVRQIQTRTGARVTLGAFHFSLLKLRAEMDDLTLHGLEPPGTAPLFHAGRVEIGLRILSIFRHKIALDRLIVERPEVAIRVETDGTSNIPHPPARRQSRPWQETLFSLKIGDLELRNGAINFNNRRTPLTLRGQALDFTLQYSAPATGPGAYIGDLQWPRVQLAARRDAPFRFGISAKFTIHPGSLELGELICNLPHSEFHLSADLPSFARPEWNLRYRGTISLADVREIFRKPSTPDGFADFSGAARFSSSKWTATGHYHAHDIRMKYDWFHAAGMETWGDYEVARRHLVVPDLRLRALGGSAAGRLEMAFQGFAFRTETKLHGASLAGILAALDHRQFPVNAMHWDGSVDVDSVNTWNANFKHFRTKGQTRWSPAGQLAAGAIPVTAQINYDYSADRRMVAMDKGEISTPSTHLDFSGTLGAADSALDANFRTTRLLDWDDFINAIRGPEAEPHRVAGSAAWQGQVLGPLGGPTFTGQVNATDASYANYYWDLLAGAMNYSPDGFRLSNATVRHDQASARINLSLEFDGDWNFPPESSWSLDVLTSRAPAQDLQAVLGTAYPLTGILSGDFRGSGTRENPILDSNFVLENIRTNGFEFDRFAGQLHLQHDEIRIASAELRVGTNGKISGDLLYRPEQRQAQFDIAGTNLAIERIKRFQTAALPLAGQLDFTLKGSGPLTSPRAQGTLRLVNFRVGAEQQGNFRGDLSSDGRSATLEITSELTRGKLQGRLSIGLHDDQPISGQISVQQLDLDPLITAGLHLSQLTGHSSVDGLFSISGALRQPDSIEVDADIQRVGLDYEFVHLTNDQDIKLSYRRNQVRIEQAHLHGPDTDLSVSGAARFDGDRPLHFALSGGADLRLLRGIFPQLDTQGSAQANVAVEGTMDQPRITGRASVRDASAHYGDFPIGLNHLNGDLVFDRNRLLFDRVTAESGGGELTLSGSVTYGEGPLRYEVSATTPMVRIRYPSGMSWIAGGRLQLSGTTTAGLLSGQVQLQRLLFARGVDVASFFAAASETTPGPQSTSAFLRNLAFDIEGQTSPGAQIEWTGAHVEMDGDVRLRGTWDRPVLLGNVHLLSGEMPFRGNTFQLTRGDINFANPFRLDPVLNVEATSTISQYQVTINFTGPASNLALNYRSDPPLPDSDIIALLALGSPGEAAGLRSQSAASQNYGATALLSEAISTGIGGRIEHLFGISQFRVDPFVAGAATEANAAARVTIQEQVTHDLTITYSSNAATSNQYQMIQVEYNVKRDLSIVFLRDINGTNGLDIKWVKHFR